MADDKPKQFGLNKPEANAKDEYLYLWQSCELGLADLIRTSDIKFDPRIPRMVRFMISLIAHDKTRQRTEEKFDAAIAAANSRKDLSLDERNELIFKISATTNGELTSYIDQFKGLSHQLKIGELVDISKKYFKESYLPDNFEVCAGDMEETVELTKTHIILLRGGSVTSVETPVENESEPTSVYTLTKDMGEDNDDTNITID